MIRVCLILLVLASCAAAPSTERLSAGQSLDIGNAGAQISLRRAQNGILSPLVHSPALQAAAQAHARDLLQGAPFGHVGSDGSTVSDRVARTGLQACASAENLASGQGNLRAVLVDWMGSETHRANLLNPGLTQFGIAREGDIWVLVMGRPC